MTAAIAEPSAELPATLGGDLARRVVELFSRGEAFDAAGFAALFAEDAIYQFGNAAPCRTREEIFHSTKAFFAQVQALYHSIRSLTEVGSTVFVEMDVVYWRHDGTAVQLPCADILRFVDSGIGELRIFMDAAPISDPSLLKGETSSVHLQRGNRHEALAGTMRHFLATPAGRHRIEAGFVPKWSMAGPRWPLPTYETEA